jgi:hypothetical protein
MGEVTNEQVNLMLRLFEERRGTGSPPTST